MGEETEESEVEAFPPNLDVITIVVDGEGAANADLGNMSPHEAITILELLADTLRDMLSPPKIRYKNRTIFNLGIRSSIEEMNWDDDDFDEDYP